MTIVDRLAGLPGVSLGVYASARRAVSGRSHDAVLDDRLRGSGPVVLVGGFCTSDQVLEPMRAWLENLGYRVLTHTLNSGMACGTHSVAEVRKTVRRAGEEGEGVHVVGYSRGGQFARILAAEPDAGIRSLVTLGSPFDLLRIGPSVALPALAVLAAGTLGVPNMATASCLVGSCCADYRRRLRETLPVPFPGALVVLNAAERTGSGRSGGVRRGGARRASASASRH